MKETEPETLTVAEAAERRTAELVLGAVLPVPTRTTWAQKLDRFIATSLIEEVGPAAPDPVHCIEVLIRIAAGVASGAGKDELWFTDYARGVFKEEHAVRKVVPPQRAAQQHEMLLMQRVDEHQKATIAYGLSRDGVLTIGFDGHRIVEPKSPEPAIWVALPRSEDVPWVGVGEHTVSVMQGVPGVRK